jgi:hypothetical protein
MELKNEAYSIKMVILSFGQKPHEHGKKIWYFLEVEILQYIELFLELQLFLYESDLTHNTLHHTHHDYDKQQIGQRILT